ncbi:PepSY domain-containing protein [Streptomyces sp. NPDC001546]|uniref:PepSY domain-containing protein n=1 Tax=Streptomyces sp. NPDC001546 TaxID=3364585 RepID=UPI0036BD0E0D
MKRNVIICTAAALALTAGGPVAVAAAATGDAARAATAAASARADVTADGAVDAALKHYPGVVESLDQDGSVWHVNVVAKNGTEAEIDVSGSGKATTRDSDTDDDGTEHASLIAAKVDAKQAMKAALAASPGKVTHLDWDDGDGGTPYWNAQIKGSDGQTRSVHVDPTSGKAATAPAQSNDHDGDNDDDGS